MIRNRSKSKQLSLAFLILLLVGFMLNLSFLENLGIIDRNDLISFVSASPSNYVNTTVHYGDLVIQQNETVVIYDAKYVVEGNIQIYGNLTVQNSELLIRYDSSQYRYLRCYSSGNLTAINSTIGYEGAPEWYTTQWYIEGDACLRSVKSPQIAWHVLISSRTFMVEDSLAHEIFIFSQLSSNNSMAIENGIIIDASNVELPAKVSFIGNNTVRTWFVFGIWCHDYSNLTIMDTSAFTFGNTSNFFVAGSKVEAKIQIFMYGYSFAYIENSTIFISHIYQNSTVILKYSTVEDIYCHNYGKLNATNTTIDYLDIHDNSWFYAKNSTIKRLNRNINVNGDGLLVINNETVISAINVVLPDVILENTLIIDYFDTHVSCYSNATLKVVDVYGTWDNHHPWHIHLHDGFREAEINHSKIEYVEVGSYSGGTLYVYNSTILHINTYYGTSLNSTFFLRKVYINRISLHGSISMICENSTVGTLNLYDNSSATLYNYTTVGKLTSYFDIYGNNYIIVNGSQILSNETSSPEVFCDKTSKIEQQEIVIRLHEESYGELINANIDRICCYDLSELNATNTTLYWVEVHSDGSLRFESCNIDSIEVSWHGDAVLILCNSNISGLWTWSDGWENLTLIVKWSFVDWLRLFGYSRLIAENSTIMNLILHHNVSAEIYFTNSSYIGLWDNSSLIAGSCCSISQLDVFYEVFGYVYMNGSSVSMENFIEPSLQVSGDTEIINLYKIFNLRGNASGTFINVSVHDINCYDNGTVTVFNTEINFVDLYGNSKAIIIGSTVHCDISLYENSNMTIRDSSCEEVDFHCYGFSTLNVANSTLSYVFIGEEASALLVDSKIIGVYCYDQSKVDFTSSNTGYVYLFGNSYLSSDNSTFDSVYAYSGSSVYFVNSTVNYLYADYNVAVTLFDTFVYSSSYSDPSSVEMIDTQSPVILGISYSPASPSEGDAITFTVQIKDMAIAEVFLLYSMDNVSWTQVSMVQVSPDSFSVTIGPFSANSTVSYQIIARDQDGRATTSPVYTIFIKGTEALPEEPGEGIGTSPGGLQPSGGIFSILFNAVLILIILLASSAIYAAVKSKTAAVSEKVFKPRLIREEKAPLERIKDLILGGDYESAYDVIRSVYKIDNVDDVLEEVPLVVRVRFSSWLLNRLLEDGFYDQAVRVALRVKDFRQLRAIYLGIAMKKLAEGDKREAMGFFEKAIEVSERMRDKRSIKVIRETLSKIY